MFPLCFLPSVVGPWPSPSTFHRSFQALSSLLLFVSIGLFFLIRRYLFFARETSSYIRYSLPCQLSFPITSRRHVLDELRLLPYFRQLLSPLVFIALFSFPYLLCSALLAIYSALSTFHLHMIMDHYSLSYVSLFLMGPISLSLTTTRHIFVTCIAVYYVYPTHIVSKFCLLLPKCYILVAYPCDLVMISFWTSFSFPLSLFLFSTLQLLILTFMWVTIQFASYFCITLFVVMYLLFTSLSDVFVTVILVHYVCPLHYADICLLPLHYSLFCLPS